MKKVEKPLVDNPNISLLILGILLSFAVGLYLFFATVSQGPIPFVYITLFFLSLIIAIVQRKKVYLVFLNMLYNLTLLTYFLLTPSSANEINTGQACLDICLGEAIIFHVVKMFSVLPLYIASILFINWLHSKGYTTEKAYKVAIPLVTVIAVLIFVLFLFVF
jgi:hypothetical protein